MCKINCKYIDFRGVLCYSYYVDIVTAVVGVYVEMYIPIVLQNYSLLVFGVCRMNRKILLWIMSFAVVATILVIPIIASATGSFSVSDPCVAAGDTFDVTVSISDADNIGSIGIVPNYDKNTFEFVGGEWLVTGALSEADITKTGAALLAFNGTQRVDGAVYAFTLRVLDTARGGTYEIGGRVTAGKALDVASASVEVESNGTSVLGCVTSYNPGNEMKIELCQNGETVYSVVVPAEVGRGTSDVTQNFEIVGVAPGEYDLIVSKKSHLTYEVRGIVVGADPIDLTTHENEQISEMRLVTGDVNGDGCIDLTDVVQLTSSSTYSKDYESAANKAADINGDKCFDLQDLVIITSSRNYGKSKVVVEY